MSKPNTGGSAFPLPQGHPGMSLREHYAGLAMAALAGQGLYNSEHIVSRIAFTLAQAMVDESNRRKEEEAK